MKCCGDGKQRQTVAGHVGNLNRFLDRAEVALWNAWANDVSPEDRQPISDLIKIVQSFKSPRSQVDLETG